MTKRAALISIHPKHVEKILSGEKKFEFRRSWATQPISSLLIYSTAPVQKIVAVARIKETRIDTPDAIWRYASARGAGLTREELFAYFKGKRTAVALRLHNIKFLTSPLKLSSVMGSAARAPQSFCYLTAEQEQRLTNQLNP